MSRRWPRIWTVHLKCWKHQRKVCGTKSFKFRAAKYFHHVSRLTPNDKSRPRWTARGPTAYKPMRIVLHKIALCKWTTCSDLQRTVWLTTHAMLCETFTRKDWVYMRQTWVCHPIAAKVFLCTRPHLLGFLRVPGRSRLIQRGPCCALILKDLSCTFAVPLSMMSSKSNCAQDAAGFEDTCFHINLGIVGKTVRDTAKVCLET